MKKYTCILAVVMTFMLNTSYAQPIPPESLEDSVLGWMKVYNFKGSKEDKKVDHRSYSAAQLSLCDSFANWIQASYLPKGGLGDVVKTLSEKLSPYNQHTAARPQSYGVYSKTYTDLKYNSSGKRVLYTDGHIWWEIIANGVPGWAIRHICTPSQYYFILPTAETEVDDEATKKRLDLTKDKNTKPYISFWLENHGFGGGTENVILSKDNRSPFIKLTKGEYLQALETAIPLFYEVEKKKIREAEQGIQSRIAVAVKSLDERIERFKTGLKKNREKYKDRLRELAMLGSKANPGLGDLEYERDVFSNQGLTDPAESGRAKYPVYKIDPAMAELCKKDKPQWIMVRWDYYSGTSFIEKQQHEAILNNFNFEYVYNFFFAPEKVKGLTYKPLRSPSYQEAVVISEASEATKKNRADKNIYFFEDFSTTGIGKKPNGWKAQLSLDGSTSVIAKPEGLNGNWAELRGHYINATQLKKPMPQDFTLSYEIVAAQNFTWGAKGLTLQLAKETSPGNAESYLKLKLRPGYGGSDGEVTLETKFPFPPGYSNDTKWLVAPGFSNNKKVNRITVSIKKKGETLQVYIDNNKIAEYEKAIPAAHLFNALSFDSGGNSRENDKYYISNIKITKD
jgi:hypothetical protein